MVEFCFDEGGFVENLGKARGEGLGTPFWRRVADIVGSFNGDVKSMGFGDAKG